MTTIDQLSKMSTAQLLDLKRVAKTVNSIIIERLAPRLNMLVSSKIEGEVHVYWEEITALTAHEVMVVGIRMFEVGDFLETEDDEHIEITEENVAQIGQRIRLVISERVLEMIEDASVPIDDVIDEMETGAAPFNSLDDETPSQPKSWSTGPRDMVDLVEDDPLALWSYTVHSKSTTKH